MYVVLTSELLDIPDGNLLTIPLLQQAVACL